MSATAIDVGLGTWGRQVENAACSTALLLLAGLPVVELALRTITGAGIPGLIGYVQHLTLWAGFLGAMIATREGRHLGLASGSLELPPAVGSVIAPITACVSSAVAAALCVASVRFVLSETASPVLVGGWLPVWAIETVLPIAFAVMALRFANRAGESTGRLLAYICMIGAAATAWFLEIETGTLFWPGIVVLVLATIMGAPIFILLGGLALLLLASEGIPLAAVPVETYRLVVSPTVATIPLFTLTGYLLAEGGASRRLVHLFRAWFGWMPGGLPIVATFVCAFFTTFTGASGLAIVALGGVLLPVLVQNGYPKRFSIGLLTSNGSIGLLFPPSLAVILYAVVAHVPIPDLFRAGVVPGLLLVGIVCALGIVMSIAAGTPRPKFDLRQAVSALWLAKWEVLLPVVVLVAMFGGFSSLTEAAAITAVYALFVETVIHRDLNVVTDLPRVLVKCATLIGGIFVILGVALGLTNYLVDAGIPMHLTAWVESHIESKLVFLLALNLFLLLVGCLMDIFSAIVIAVPLVLPVSAAFDVHPLHVAVIFLINLELGYLTPPVGLNLFLASYRFDTPIIEIYRSTLPFFLAMLIVVLVVTYVPQVIIGL